MPPAFRPATLLLALAAACALAVPAPASAFSSLPGGPHDDITAGAARESGFPDGAIDDLVEAVRDVDIRDNALEPDADQIDRIDATADYRPEHHCDRVSDSTDADAFNATVAYVDERSQAAVAAVKAGDPGLSVRMLGEVLHAVQDCLSHSNAVDLPDPMLVAHAVNGHAPAPAGLRLTSFQPGAEDPETPPGDDYPHSEFAKDSADKNDESEALLADGRTKFEAARDLAHAASMLALQDVLGQLDADDMEALEQAEGDGGQPIPRVGVPAPPATLTLAALAGATAWAVALARRRR